MNSLRLPALLAIALLHAGCAVIDKVPPAAAFDVLGRVLASGEGRAFSSNLRWRHGPDEDEIWLMSPVGQTLAHIAVNPSGATLTAADQQVYRAGSAESLTESAFGWTLPLSRLRHWIRGDAVPGGANAVVRNDARGRIEQIDQDGWTVRYAYADEAGAAQHPRRLDVSRDDRRIRLVIDDWRDGVRP